MVWKLIQWSTFIKYRMLKCWWLTVDSQSCFRPGPLSAVQRCRKADDDGISMLDSQQRATGSWQEYRSNPFGGLSLKRSCSWPPCWWSPSCSVWGRWRWHHWGGSSYRRAARLPTTVFTFSFLFRILYTWCLSFLIGTPVRPETMPIARFCTFSLSPSCHGD